MLAATLWPLDGGCGVGWLIGVDCDAVVCGGDGRPADEAVGTVTVLPQPHFRDLPAKAGGVENFL